MAKYIVKFTDGSVQDYGVPGPDSELRRKNVIVQMESTTGQSVASVEKVDISPKPAKAKKAQAAMGSVASKKGKRGRKPGAVSSAKGTVAKYAAAGSSTTTQEIGRLEQVLMHFMAQVSTEIDSLKRTVLANRKRELLMELDDIDMQMG